MSLISSFSKQTATHERYTGKDGFGKPAYAVPVIIKVRKDPAKGVKRSATGTDVAVETEYLSEAVVSVQDKVDGSVVRRSAEIIWTNGRRLGCEFAV